MPAAAALSSERPALPAEKIDEVRELQARIRAMQSTTLDSRVLDTSPTVAGLLPGGSLKTGVAYTIEGSTSLGMALMAGPSQAGAWCGVVGVPTFGTEAAKAAGIDLERLALAPYPGDQWLPVTAALADVLTVVLVRPPLPPSDGSVARLMARLRERGTTLIVLGQWPGAEARLRVRRSQWGGLGDGHGHLTSRQLTVEVEGRTGSARERMVRL
jgi:hypothetical protein